MMVYTEEVCANCENVSEIEDRYCCSTCGEQFHTNDEAEEHEEDCEENK